MPSMHLSSLLCHYSEQDTPKLAASVEDGGRMSLYTCGPACVSAAVAGVHLADTLKGRGGVLVTT